MAGHLFQEEHDARAVFSCGLSALLLADLPRSKTLAVSLGRVAIFEEALWIKWLAIFEESHGGSANCAGEAVKASESFLRRHAS